MAKSTKDLANVLGVIMGFKDFSGCVNNSWKGLRVGFVDPALWQASSYAVERNEGYSDADRVTNMVTW